MKTPVTDALVARIHDFAETSAVAVLLTADRGAVHVLAKGGRRAANGFKGPLDRGVLYRVRLGRRAGEGLVPLHAATVREPFARVRRDPPRFLAASLAMEVASDLMREGEPHGDLFRLTVFTLKVLDRAPPERVPLAAALFLARAALLSGHVPEIDCCVACGEPLGRAARPLLSPLRGGVLHGDCGKGEPGARGVATPVLGLLRTMWSRPAAEVLTLSPEPRGLRDLRLLLADWLEHVLDRRFRSAAPAEREFAGTRG